jgi:hypothetical protein
MSSAARWVTSAEKRDAIDPSDPSELAALFGDDTVVFEFAESGRTGAHDGSTCLVAIGSSNRW